MRMIRTFLLVMAAASLIGTISTLRSPASAGAASDLAPLFTPGTWLNGSATAPGLRGKVVVVDIFTFGCINCKHVVPNLRRLHAMEPTASFALVGVHAPETAYERNRENVSRNLAALGITWPVRIDNDFAVWQAYGIEYWPTQLIFDRRGRLRKTVIGEGQDDVVNATVRDLMREAH